MRTHQLLWGVQICKIRLLAKRAKLRVFSRDIISLKTIRMGSSVYMIFISKTETGFLKSLIKIYMFTYLKLTLLMRGATQPWLLE